MMVVNSTYYKENLKEINYHVFVVIVNKVLSHLFQYLNLREIPIEYCYDKNEGYLGAFNHRELKIRLNLEILDIEDLINYDCVNGIFFENHYQRMLNVLCHELGHYVQKARHEKWMNKHRKEYILFEYSGNNDYRAYKKLKLESNANKIGDILFKRVSRLF